MNNIMNLINTGIDNLAAIVHLSRMDTIGLLLLVTVILFIAWLVAAINGGLSDTTTVRHVGSVLTTDGTRRTYDEGSDTFDGKRITAVTRK